MVSVIATLLVGVLLVINKTHAQTAQLSLSVTAGTISACTAATGINIWSIWASASVTTLSWTTWLGNNFGCTDLKGSTSWNYTMSSSALAGSPAWTIAANNISLTTNGAITVTAWTCPSVTTGAGWTLDTAKNLITKTAGNWQTCTFHLPTAQAKITVSIPAWSPVGSYTSTLTIVYPS